MLTNQVKVWCSERMKTRNKFGFSLEDQVAFERKVEGISRTRIQLEI